MGLIRRSNGDIDIKCVIDVWPVAHQSQDHTGQRDRPESDREPSATGSRYLFWLLHHDEGNRRSGQKYDDGPPKVDHIRGPSRCEEDNQSEPETESFMMFLHGITKALRDESLSPDTLDLVSAELLGIDLEAHRDLPLSERIAVVMALGAGEAAGSAH